MSSLDKKLEKEIVDLKGDIRKQMIDLSAEDMTQELLELRHLVFEAHSEVEFNMEISIGLDILHSSGKKVTDDIPSKYVQKINPIFSSLGFAKKFSLFKSLFTIEGKPVGNRFDDINKLNEIRNTFAHPKSKNYKKYTDRPAYMSALKIIKNALTLSNQLPLD